MDVREALLAATSRSLCLPPSCEFAPLSIEEATAHTTSPEASSPFAAHTTLNLPCDAMCQAARGSKAHAPGRAHALHRFTVRPERCGCLNEQLLRWALCRETTLDAAHKTNVGGFQSGDTLFDVEAAGEPALRELHALASTAMDMLGPQMYPIESRRPALGKLHPACACAEDHRSLRPAVLSTTAVLDTTAVPLVAGGI